MEEFKSDSSIRRVLNNGFFSGIQLVAYTVAGIFLTPFLLREFGESSFGLIALAGFLTQYVGMISGCVGNSVSRFLNIALNRNDWDEAREIFSTALLGNAVILLLQVPVFVLGIWKLHWLIDYPPEQAFDFKILVSCNIGMFVISVMVGVFSTPILAANRLDWGMKVDVVFHLLRILLLFILISWIGARLWIVGVVDLSLSLIGAVITYALCRKLAKSLVFRWSNVAFRWLRPILGMAGFMLITALANSLFFKTDVWMLNRFVDAKIAGIYAALRIWPNFLTQIANRITGVVGATYFIDYAKKDHRRISRNALFSEKMLAFFTVMATCGFVFFGEFILSFWLGRDATLTERYLLILFFVTASFSLQSDALWRIFQAFNKPKVPGIIALACGILNIALSIMLIRMGMGVYGVIAGTMISSFLLRALFQPWYAARLLGEKPMTLWYPIIISFLLSLLGIGAKQLQGLLGIDHWTVSIFYLAASGVLVLQLLFSRDERVLFLKTMRQFVDRR